jgi:hypothetical protein
MIEAMLWRQVFEMERSRLNAGMRREMEAEAMKVKDRATGEVRWGATLLT